jgi:hypothetical protein
MAGKRPRPRRQTGAAAPGRGRLVGIILKGLVALALVTGVVLAIARLGDEAGRAVADRDRYTVRLADVECDAPPGLDRAAFLAEVRYLADVPEAVQSVDPDLPARLSAAFARHPWVAEVVGVTVGPGAAVRVGLRFRVPVLAVRVAGEPDPRAVDRAAVLLPHGAPTDGLPLLATPVRPPATPAGEVWADPAVRRAAELAETYRPRRIEKSDKGWRLIRDNGPTLVVGF